MLDRLTDLLEVSLGCGAVIFLLLALTPLLSKRFSPRLRYWAWALLAVRLLLPGIPWDRNTIPAPIQIETPHTITAPAYDGMAQDIKAALPYGYTADVFSNTTYHVWYSDDQNNSIRAYDNPLFRLEGYNDNWSLSFHWEGIWMAGLLLCLGWQFSSYFAFCRRIKRFAIPANGEDWTALAAQQQLLGLQRKVNLVRNETISSPLLMGFVKPTIVLPTQLPEHTLAPSLSHELTHLKRGDLWYQLLLILARCVHWFNPLVWRMVRQAKRDMELCCDYDLLQSQDVEVRRSYGQAILDQMTAGQSTSSLTTGFSGDKKSIFTRFKAIMDTSPKKKGTAVLVLILCAVALAGGLVALNGTPEKEAVTVTLASQPEQVVEAKYYQNSTGFPWLDDELPTLTMYDTRDTLYIQIPEHIGQMVSLYTPTKVEHSFAGPDHRVGVQVDCTDLENGEHSGIFHLHWGAGAQFDYAFRVVFPAVTAYLDDHEDESIMASYYPNGFHGDFKDLPTLYADQDSICLTIQFPNDFTAPAYLGHTQYSGVGILEEVPEIDFQELSLRSLEDNNTRYGPNTEFSISLLGLETGFEHMVFFLTWGEDSQFHYVFQVKAKPNPELTLTDAFDLYPSGPFSVSATEQDAISYYKFENTPAGISILMPEHCQTDPSIISYRGKTITTILPCNPLSGYLYGNAGGIASFTTVDLTGDGKEELLYLWGYGGAGVWEDQCKIFDLSTMEELPVSPVDEELLATYVQAELLDYEDDYAGIFRITTADGTVTYGSTTAQDTAQPLGPVELRFDGYTHLNLEGNQLKMSLAFSPVSDGTFLYAMSYLGDLTGTLTYSPSLRAFTPSPPFTMELYDPIEYQP